MPLRLDDRDRQLLLLLQADAWLTYKELAEKVNLSPSAVQRRVERLIAGQVLLGAHARTAMDFEVLRLTLFVLVDLVDDSAATIRRFTEEIISETCVAEAHYVTGEADVALWLRVGDMGEYDAFVERRINANSIVRRFKTFTGLRPLK